MFLGQNLLKISALFTIKTTNYIKMQLKLDNAVDIGKMRHDNRPMYVFVFER